MLYLEKVRDAFLILCYTGLRHSDLIQIKKENISNGFLKIITQKTKTTLKIPVSRPLQKILNKYHDCDLPVISLQKMDEYLKILGEKAGLDDDFEKVTFSGNQRIIWKDKKYNFLTTHTGRRTFITLSLEKGMRSETVMKITGHKDMRSFQKYIKLTDTVVKDEMLRVWGQ